MEEGLAMVGGYGDVALVEGGGDGKDLGVEFAGEEGWFGG